MRSVRDIDKLASKIALSIDPRCWQRYQDLMPKAQRYDNVLLSFAIRVLLSEDGVKAGLRPGVREDNVSAEFTYRISHSLVCFSPKPWYFMYH